MNELYICLVNFVVLHGSFSFYLFLFLFLSCNVRLEFTGSLVGLGAGLSQPVVYEYDGSNGVVLQYILSGILPTSCHVMHGPLRCMCDGCGLAWNGVVVCVWPGMVWCGIGAWWHAVCNLTWYGMVWCGECIGMSINTC